ncbi:neuroligin-4, X-linked-like isoform X2 [Lineus longissimus]|uniref:neuroligin-4, X-linked-like isoform X2 n=1 Tax=Lineus longissimus TaxID=88925 RepID=UPI002B4E8F89
MTKLWILLLQFLAVLADQPDGAQGRVYTRDMSPRTIETKYGKLRGMLVEIPNKHLPPVEAYLGLGYASLLGGNLRFMPPTSPMEQWNGVRVAITHRPVCPQKIPTEEELAAKYPKGRMEHFKRLIPFLKDQNEDCLNLNVYVPTRGENNTNADPFPILMFIHGESYAMGTGNAYDGSILASFGEVIVITLNYRLGALGFMTTGDQHAPGNYAIFDIVAALQWTKENIAAFGGDPEQVTVMGQGYGGALVNLLMVSPVTKDGTLLKRGIVMSGSALSPWAISDHPRYYAKKLAQAVNCSEFFDNSKALLGCLRELSASDLMEAEVRAPKYFEPFGPVIHKSSILPQPVKQLMERAAMDAERSELLIGVMKNEGFCFFEEEEIQNGITPSKRDKIIRTLVKNIYEFHKQKVYDIISHHYMDYEREPDNETLLNNMMDMLGDVLFAAPAIDLARRHSAIGRTFFYSFTYPSRLDSFPRWAGGVHGEDLMYVFGAPLADGITPFPSTYTRSERMLSEAVMRYWTNFMKTGNPNLPESQTSLQGGRVKNRFIGLEWPVFMPPEQKYLHIAGMRPDIRSRYRGNKVALWLELIPKVHKEEEGTPKRHHYLNNYYNKSSFEKNTKNVDIPMYLVPPPTNPPTEAPITYQVVVKPRTTTPEPNFDDLRLNQATEGSAVMLDKYRPTDPPTNGRPVLNADSSMALSITIAVGCSLLFLNILVFAIVYYQRDKLKTKKKEDKARHKQDNEKNQARSPNNHEIADHRKMNHVDSNMTHHHLVGNQTAHHIPPPPRTTSAMGSHHRSPVNRSPYDTPPHRNSPYSTMTRTYSDNSDDGKNPVTVV